MSGLDPAEHHTLIATFGVTQILLTRDEAIDAAKLIPTLHVMGDAARIPNEDLTPRVIHALVLSLPFGNVLGLPFEVLEQVFNIPEGDPQDTARWTPFTDYLTQRFTYFAAPLPRLLWVYHYLKDGVLN